MRASQLQPSVVDLDATNTHTRTRREGGLDREENRMYLLKEFSQPPPPPSWLIAGYRTPRFLLVLCRLKHLEVLLYPRALGHTPACRDVIA